MTKLIKKKKLKNIFILVLLIGIIFFLIYILKIGGVSLLKSDNNNITTKTTSKSTTSTIITTSSSTTTTKKITTSATIKKTTLKASTTKKSETSNVALKYVDGILIVNKSYPLPEDFVPANTYKNAKGLSSCSTCIDKEAYESYKQMKADATSLGLNIWIQSGYRSYDLQKSLYEKYVNRDGKTAADTYSARPGHSEHQTGLAFDLNTITDAFQYTDEGKWVNDNAYRYGFILRYPKGKEHITGYKYESWHLRYVGVDLATKLYNNGDWISLEEYFNLTSTYS